MSRGTVRGRRSGSPRSRPAGPGPGGRGAPGWLALLLAVPLLSCGAPGESAAQSDADDYASEEVRRVAAGDSWETDFSKRSIPLSEIRRGGPPKDGIPAIDDPEFEDSGAADEWLEPSSPVMVVTVGGATKGYPLSILIAHEIVNDRVGGRPVTVTYCPLCNTALAFDRRVGERVLDFGTTGRLRHSDLVMYDRQTETWWQQASGEAIIGDLLGTELEFVPANIFSWETAKELHPDLEVLSRDTGYRRDYGRNPYAGYDRAGREPMGRFLAKEPDTRLPPMERVAALELGDGWAAPFSRLEEERVANVEVAGEPVVVFWAPGASSALDARRVSEGRDVGQTAAYRPVVDGRRLTFRWEDGAFRDGRTDSAWNLGGRATDGPLEGTTLEPVVHGNHFWFAWAAFRPDTEIWSPEEG